jgi:hypothetical protein
MSEPGEAACTSSMAALGLAGGATQTVFRVR